MKVYRCKICGAVKSRRNGYFRVPDKDRIPSPGQLENPGKLRIMLHIAAAHLSDEEEFDEDSIEVVNI